VDQALEDFRAGEAQRKTEVQVVTAQATASEQKVADAFHELGALQEPLKVSVFWTGRLNSPLRKALSP
jgi:sulfonate transport system substrate-binding protein